MRSQLKNETSHQMSLYQTHLPVKLIESQACTGTYRAQSRIIRFDGTNMLYIRGKSNVSQSHLVICKVIHAVFSCFVMTKVQRQR